MVANHGALSVSEAIETAEEFVDALDANTVKALCDVTIGLVERLPSDAAWPGYSCRDEAPRVGRCGAPGSRRRRISPGPIHCLGQACAQFRTRKYRTALSAARRRSIPNFGTYRRPRPSNIVDGIREARSRSLQVLRQATFMLCSLHRRSPVMQASATHCAACSVFCVPHETTDPHRRCRNSYEVLLFTCTPRERDRR